MGLPLLHGSSRTTWGEKKQVCVCVWAGGGGLKERESEWMEKLKR